MFIPLHEYISSDVYSNVIQCFRIQRWEFMHLYIVNTPSYF